MIPDSQVVELLGRQQLIAGLLRDGLEVAVPARDRGIDLIAYANLSRQVSRFSARPIQMKASTVSGFGVDQKYGRFADLILAYVWHLDDPKAVVTYAMTYDDAVKIAEALDWTKTQSWAQGQYVTNNPSKQLLAMLESHRMLEGQWWNLVVGDAALQQRPYEACPQ